MATPAQLPARRRALGLLAGRLTRTGGGATRADSEIAANAYSTNNVKIVDFAFNPGTIIVPPGTTVTWTNTGASTALRDINRFGDEPGRIRSGILNPGQSYSFTFDTPGTYDYFCGCIHSCEARWSSIPTRRAGAQAEAQGAPQEIPEYQASRGQRPRPRQRRQGAARPRMTTGDPGAVRDRSWISLGFSWSPRREDAHAPPERGEPADCRGTLDHTDAFHRHAGRHWSSAQPATPAAATKPSTIVFAAGSKRRLTPTRDAAPSGSPRSGSMTPETSRSSSPCVRKTTSTPSGLLPKRMSSASCAPCTPDQTARFAPRPCWERIP